MIDRVIEFSIRNRSLVIAAALVLAIWGVVAVYQTPIDAIPDLSENQVIVFTDWSGHSPREIEDQVTYPLSLGLQGMAGVKSVRSSSDFNFSSISVIFDDSVSFTEARGRVAERLASRRDQLPAGVAPQLAPDSLATGQIFWYTVEGAGHDLGRLRAIQDWYVRPQLASVPGVAEVASVGGMPIEFQIEVDPLRLRSTGVTMPDVLRAIGRSNSTASAHVLQKANAEYIVRAVGWLGANESGDASVFDPSRVVRDIESIPLAPIAADSHQPEAPAREVGGSPAPVRRATPRVADVATVSLGPGVRRGVLEKDGNEVTGGVVLMRFGENPLEVTRRIKDKLVQLQPGLPSGVRIVPGYDRTPLITGAVGTVTSTLVEAIVTASICVLLVLLHVRTSFIIAVTLPLATLASFVVMWTLRRLGVADIQTNIMSLAGIAISIGVLVDSSIVMAENAMHSLREQFGDRPVRGDIRALVLPACRTVGRPIFFSVVIMLISFVPVFALGGMEGKMFRPLAFTKSFALIAVAALSITLVPALCTIFIKGRLRRESESWIVRSVMDVYKPVLSYLLDRPAVLAWIMSATFVVGLTPVGSRSLFLGTLFLSVLACGYTASGWRGRLVSIAAIVLVALVADQNMAPLGREFMTPLDEGTAMDMPITVPRASVTQSGDDLKARDMILCRFPEVEMVMGKAGRAETATDPAPMDMIETMVNFRPTDLWPRRRMLARDAERQTRAVLGSLVARGLIDAPIDQSHFESLVGDASASALAQFDNVMREFAYLKNQEFSGTLAPSLVVFLVNETARYAQRGGKLRRNPSTADLAIVASRYPADLVVRLEGGPLIEDVVSIARHTTDELVRLEIADAQADLLAERPGLTGLAVRAVTRFQGGGPSTVIGRLHEASRAKYRASWREHVRQLDGEVLDRAAMTFTRLAVDELLAYSTIKDSSLARLIEDRKRLRALAAAPRGAASGHHGARATGPLPDPHPALNSLQREFADSFGRRLLLWPHERTTLAGFGSEMDRLLQMPGWTNVWTAPIQNRVDMLATGVNTAIGVRVLGGSLDEVVRVSEEIAAVLKRVPGAADVVADPIRGKGYLQVRPDRNQMARYGVSAEDVSDAVETALAGRVVTTVVAGRERHPVRVRYARAWRTDDESVENVLVATRGAASNDRVNAGRPQAAGFVPVGQLAGVEITEGPATIKSENGLLRNYVRLNVRDRGVVDFVDEARRTVAAQVKLPAGVFVEWTGQFEHQVRARNTLLVALPIVVVSIFAVLYFTYRDLADAVLMMLAVPGALAGGVLFQWIFGYNFSVTVWIGYIACFGMATATGIIMLVYLREAVERAGGLERISLARLRQAVLDGAVHRLRPKLLTEGTTIIGLAPMLWATGPGAEVIRPMAAPVMGGILVADEVIDLFLPVLFYAVRRRRWVRTHAADRRDESRRTTVEVSDDPADPDGNAGTALVHSSFSLNH
jgi:Cu(I)/Ag(I) efflux system membrane protein CusA/SilA